MSLLRAELGHPRLSESGTPGRGRCTSLNEGLTVASDAGRDDRPDPDLAASVEVPDVFGRGMLPLGIEAAAADRRR
jgi:hypothetical protein